jgi:hypothetical protein
MAFSYKAHPNELIGKEVDASYLYGGRTWISSYGCIDKFLSKNRVRLVHADNSFSTRVFRKEWEFLYFTPKIDDVVYGESTRLDADTVGMSDRRYYWMGTVQEVHPDHVIVKQSITGRLSKRKAIRPRP